MAARLAFDLQGAGWASITITSGTFTHTIQSISYLTDALDDLLRMGLDVATDKGWSFAEFDHEGGQTVLVAETSWVEENDWSSGARLSAISNHVLKGSPVSREAIRDLERGFVLSVGSRDELAALFLSAAQRVFETHGEDGYKAAWGGRLAFPMRAMKALEAALSCRPLPPVNYGG